MRISLLFARFSLTFARYVPYFDHLNFGQSHSLNFRDTFCFLSASCMQTYASQNHTASAALAMCHDVAQVGIAFTASVSHAISGALLVHRGVCKLLSVVTKVVATLAAEGFCMPQETEEGDGKGDMTFEDDVAGKKQLTRGFFFFFACIFKLMNLL
jgi:hypothetical protein